MGREKKKSDKEDEKKGHAALHTKDTFSFLAVPHEKKALASGKGTRGGETEREWSFSKNIFEGGRKTGGAWGKPGESWKKNKRKKSKINPGER